MKNPFAIRDLILGCASVFALTLTPLAHAESYATAFTSVFKSADGRPATVKDVAPDKDGRGYLVMFWASWCVPCKEELAFVTKNAEALKNWNIIAVNTDDAGGRVRADAILKTLNWPFPTLNDEAGTLFYQINPSGELPLALGFDPSGRLIEILRELKEPALEKLSATQFQAATQHGWEVSDQFHYIQRQLAHGTSDVGANTLGVKFFSEHWETGATHNLIRQRRDSAVGWARFEDDIGPSYLQYQTRTSGGMMRARVGDDAVEWGKGQLLSARAIPGSDVNASLQGAHFSQNFGSYSLTASAGRVRQQLFGLLLDPTVDLTPEAPVETAFGGTLRKNIELDGDVSLFAAVGGVGYRRESLNAISSSYLSPYEDRRAHLNLGVKTGTWGLDVAKTRYFIKHSQFPDQKVSDSLQADGFLRSSADAKFQLGLTFTEKHHAIPRTFTPVLTDYPASPLFSDGVRAFRLAPRAGLEKWSFEPQWIVEESNDKNDYEKQNTYVLAAYKPELEFKSILLYQRHGSTPLKYDADQAAAVVGSALSSSVTSQVEYKTYKAKGRPGNSAADQGGRSAALQLGLKLDRVIGSAHYGKFLLSVTRTHQDGYYLTTSGIDKKELTGYRLNWALGGLELRVAACQEPGGFVCSGGVCAQRPPLNGFSIESDMHWNF